MKAEKVFNFKLKHENVNGNSEKSNLTFQKKKSETIKSKLKIDKVNAKLRSRWISERKC